MCAIDSPIKPARGSSDDDVTSQSSWSNSTFVRSVCLAMVIYSAACRHTTIRQSSTSSCFPVLDRSFVRAKSSAQSSLLGPGALRPTSPCFFLLHGHTLAASLMIVEVFDGVPPRLRQPRFSLHCPPGPLQGVVLVNIPLLARLEGRRSGA